jgi:hypothetical protein
MSPSIRISAVAFSLSAAAVAQVQDAPPVNTTEMLATLRQLRDTQATQAKASKQSALKNLSPLAGNAALAAAAWEDAVRATQFQGVARESIAFREWMEKEGIGLKGKEAQNAARLYFAWLNITLQRSNGASVKDLLPQLIAYTRDLQVDQQAAQVLADSVQREKDSAPQGARRFAPSMEKRVNDRVVKHMHDQIMNKGLANSPVVQWMKLSDFVTIEKWENNPGNLEGIYNKILLPELRAEKDPRVLDYWDLKIKRESELASAKHVDFEIAKFNTERLPELRWSRAEDVAAIGQKNKAATEMLALIKANPGHPAAAEWIGKLEELLSPTPPAAPVPAPAPPAP